MSGVGGKPDLEVEAGSRRAHYLCRAVPRESSALTGDHLVSAYLATVNPKKRQFLVLPTTRISIRMPRCRIDRSSGRSACGMRRDPHHSRARRPLREIGCCFGPENERDIDSLAGRLRPCRQQRRRLSHADARHRCDRSPHHPAEQPAGLPDGPRPRLSLVTCSVALHAGSRPRRSTK